MNDDELIISTSPGLISALVFILFDIFLLTWLDESFARLLSAFYYRRIFRHGDALRVQSADLPCVTNFLVGSRLSLINNGVILLKLAILGVMLFVDLSINSRVRPELVTLRSTFGFNLSQAEWGSSSSFGIEAEASSNSSDENLRRVVRRRWAEVRECRLVEERSDMNNITFYSLGFNLSGNIVIDDERQPDGSETITLNESTLTCLRPDVVDQPVVAAVVRGCSPLRNGPCYAAMPLSILIDLPFDREHIYGIQKVPEGTGLATFALFNFPVELWESKFPSYAVPNATLTCSRTHFKIPGQRTSENGTNLGMPTVCLFIVPTNQTTLVEKWKFQASPNLLIREFPGAVFEGDVDIGPHQRANLLFNLYRENNWITVASVIVAEGAVYRHLTPTNFAKPGNSHTITYIPYSAVIVSMVLLVVTLTLRLAVWGVFVRDHRPQINSIDGLSSIAREEVERSGRSMLKGRTSYVGFALGGKSTLRFGPLVDPALAVRPIHGVDVV